VTQLQQFDKIRIGGRLCPHGSAMIRCRNDPGLRGWGAEEETGAMLF